MNERDGALLEDQERRRSELLASPPDVEATALLRERASPVQMTPGDAAAVQCSSYDDCKLRVKIRRVVSRRHSIEKGQNRRQTWR